MRSWNYHGDKAARPPRIPMFTYCRDGHRSELINGQTDDPFKFIHLVSGGGIVHLKPHPIAQLASSSAIALIDVILLLLDDR